MKTVTSIRRLVLLVPLASVVLVVSSATAQFRGHATAPGIGFQAKTQLQSSKPNLSLKSESTAKSWSLWATVIPTTVGVIVGGNDNIVAANILVGTGILLGPATGYFYGGCAGRGAKGILIRAVTGGVAAAIAISVANSSDKKDFSDLTYGMAAIGIGGLGAAVVTYEIIYDIAHVRSEVRARNDKIGIPSFSLTPTYFPQSQTFGLQLRLTL